MYIGKIKERRIHTQKETPHTRMTNKVKDGGRKGGEREETAR